MSSKARSKLPKEAFSNAKFQPLYNSEIKTLIEKINDMQNRIHSDISHMHSSYAFLKGMDLWRLHDQLHKSTLISQTVNSQKKEDFINRYLFKKKRRCEMCNKHGELQNAHIITNSHSKAGSKKIADEKYTNHHINVLLLCPGCSETVRHEEFRKLKTPIKRRLLRMVRKRKNVNKKFLRDLRKEFAATRKVYSKIEQFSGRIKNIEKDFSRKHHQITSKKNREVLRIQNNYKKHVSGLENKRHKNAKSTYSRFFR